MPAHLRPVLLVIVAMAAAMRVTWWITGDPAWREASSTVLLVGVVLAVWFAQPRRPTP